MSMRKSHLLAATAILLTAPVALVVAAATAADTDQPAARGLKAPADFASVADMSARSAALFTEAGKVIQHARCVNCHPAGDVPRQGDVRRRHEPHVVRGDGGMGAPGLRCTTCHGEQNFDAGRVPGHPRWHLAPAEVAWEGKSLGNICREVKDPARNGGMDLPKLVRHMAEDDLVGWAWTPGAGREPAPGTQKAFGALIQAWADSGAACPEP